MRKLILTLFVILQCCLLYSQEKAVTRKNTILVSEEGGNVYSAKVICKLNKGDTVTFTSAFDRRMAGTWTLVKYGEIQGLVRTKHIGVIKPRVPFDDVIDLITWLNIIIVASSIFLRFHPNFEYSLAIRYLQMLIMVSISIMLVKSLIIDDMEFETIFHSADGMCDGFKIFLGSGALAAMQFYNFKVWLRRGCEEIFHEQYNVSMVIKASLATLAIFVAMNMTFLGDYTGWLTLAYLIVLSGLGVIIAINSSNFLRAIIFYVIFLSILLGMLMIIGYFLMISFLIIFMVVSMIIIFSLVFSLFAGQGITTIYVDSWGNILKIVRPWF